MKAIIFDVDGTLANCNHRLHYVQNGQKRWKSFFDEMHLDAPITEIIDLATALHDQGYKILVVSARPDDYKGVTINWLDEESVPFDRIYMRKAGDYRADAIVKAEILQQIRDDGFEPYIVVDDRQQVVDMWRENGIMTLHCAPVEIEPSKYIGQTLLHMMVGPSGAGKSTYISNNYKPDDVVSSDAIRTQLFGSYEADICHTPEGMSRTWDYIHELLTARLKHGVFTVFDATNIRNKDRKSILKLVPDGVLAQYIIIDRPLEQKLETRGWRPEWLVNKHHNTFVSNLKDILKGDGLPNVTVIDQRNHI